MALLRVKHWAKFQHYKDRCPPWIKLATDTFQNYDFSRLQDASKLLAVCIWTLAARSQDGNLPHDFEYIKTQCCLGNSIKLEHLKELITQGFIESDSEVLADCKQSACLEGEGETEGEKRQNGAKRASTFPEGFVLSPQIREYAIGKGILNPEAEFEQFRNRHTAKAAKFVDWEAAWRTWILNAVKFGRSSTPHNSGDFQPPKKLNPNLYREQ